VQPLSASDPRTAGEFTLRARLGAGGMGRVYLGYSPAGRAVAVKVVHPELARDEEFLARFRNEVAAARAVSGLYTAPVVASGLADDPPWLATVYVAGPALDDVIGKHGPLPEPSLWRLAAGLSEALLAVHASGLVHRDLKPSNVLLAADGPHVIDFGISRAMGGTHLTATGMVVGTPGYMSPEQAEGHEAGPPSDVFSLACVVAYAATGKQPFGSGSAASVLYRVVATEPDLAGVPPRLLEVLQPCLRKNPAERPQLPAVAAAFSRGAGTMADSALGLTSFWPQEVTDIIRGATQDTPGASGGSGTSGPGPSGSPLSPMPGSLPGVQRPYSGAQPHRGQPQPAPPQMTPSQANSAYAGQPGAYTGQPGSYTPPRAYPSSYQPPSYHAAPPLQTPPPGTPVPPWPSPGAAPGGQTPPPQAAYGQAGYAAQQAPWQSAQQPSAQQPSAQPAPGWQVPTPFGSPPGQTPLPGQVPVSGQTPAPAWTAAGSGTPSIVGPHVYKPGSRRPRRAEVPAPVINALRLMYTGLAATVLAIILSVVDIAHLGNLAKQYQYVNTVAYNRENLSIGLIAIVALVGGIVGVVIWILCAVAVRRGRQWGAVLGTVFFGLDFAGMLVIAAGTHDDPATIIMSVLVCLIGLVAVILLWQNQSRAFYRAFK
jgi:serine/threonine protein kinase